MPLILTFSTVEWHYLWHRPQAVMSRLAGDGWPVLYVDTLGLRSPRPRDLMRILSRLRIRGARDGFTRTPVQGVQVISPLLLPFLNSRLACQLNVRHLVPRLRDRIESLGEDYVIIWVYLPTWTVLQCIRAIPHSLLVYEVIDALASNPAGVSKGFYSSEREIQERADLVVTSSESLYREKAIQNPNTHWVPSGVDEGFFSAGVTAQEMQTIRGPRIGFFGTVDHRLDLDLISRLASDNPDWSFVLIGPVRCEVKKLANLDNVYCLGSKSHETLPTYLSGLDVIFLPYIIDEFTRHIYPAKIHECLAMGLPIVATALPSLTPFEGLVRLVRPGQSFAESISAALVEDDQELCRQRRKLALANSWDKRYQDIRKLVVDAIDEKSQGGI